METPVILEHVISENRISMELKKVRSNPIVYSGNDYAEIEHYKCRLYKPGKYLDVYLSIEAENGLLLLADVLFMLIMDASGCRMLEGFEQDREHLTSIFGGSDGNFKEIDNFWREYQERCRQTEELRGFLGETVYEELLHHFRMEDTV